MLQTLGVLITRQLLEDKHRESWRYAVGRIRELQGLFRIYACFPVLLNLLFILKRKLGRKRKAGGGDL